jgi:hypothetical protein
LTYILARRPPKPDTASKHPVHAFYCDHFVLPLPAGHRFPMEKYALLRARIAAEPDIALSVPDGATPEALGRVHDPG